MARTVMASCSFLVIFFLINTGSLAQTSWDQTQIIATQDPKTVITMTCTVNLGDDMFGVVRIFRKIMEDGEMKEYAISDNDAIKENVASMGRYTVVSSNNMDTGIRTSILTIEGVRGEDEGQYGCVSISEYDKASYLQVHVKVPISEIYMIKISDASEMALADAETVHLSEGKAMGVGCVVKIDGGLETPRVVLTVDGEDRADLFTPLIDSKRVQETVTGPEKYFTEVKYTYVTVLPSSELNQKNLTCVATAEDFPSRQASAYLDIKYKPVITCPQYFIYVPKGDPVTIKCVLRANPGARVTWSYGDDRNDAMLVDTSAPEGLMAVKESPFSEDTTNIELVIEKVTSKHFTQYYLTAENDIGETEVKVTLKKGATVTEPPKKQNEGNPPSNTVESNPQDPKADSVQSNTSAASHIAVTPAIILLLLLILKVITHSTAP